MGKGIEWERIHDLKAYHVYRRVKEGEDKIKLCEELSKKEGFKKRGLSSIIIKIENYRYIDTDGRKGCKGYSEQAKSVEAEYKDRSIQEIEQAISQHKKNTDPAKNMDDLKERAQVAQSELLDVVLEFFKQNPNECFTAGPITKALGLFKGNDKSNTWLAQSIMNELSNRKDFENCEHGKGKKYIGNHIDNMG